MLRINVGTSRLTQLLSRTENRNCGNVAPNGARNTRSKRENDLQRSHMSLVCIARQQIEAEIAIGAET